MIICNNYLIAKSESYGIKHHRTSDQRNFLVYIHKPCIPHDYFRFPCMLQINRSYENWCLNYHK